MKGFLPATFVFKSLVNTNSDGSTSTISLPTYDELDLPEGWEPVSGSEFGAITARRCVSQ